MFRQGHVNPFWTNEYKFFNYKEKYFNDPILMNKWIDLGYKGNFGGGVYDMQNKMPAWTSPFFSLFPGIHTSITFFKMLVSDILPTHSDTYQRFIEIHKIKNPKSIKRSIIFLEDWKSGHIFEIENQAMTNWKAGDFVLWEYDTPHMAANLGLEPRFTLQITFVDNL